MIIRITHSLRKQQIAVNENGEFYCVDKPTPVRYTPNPHEKGDALLIGYAYNLIDRDHYTINGARKVYALYQESRDFS